MGDSWMTFDCFGTLVDWHSGYTATLRPIAGDRVPELLAAYHRHEPILESERPHRSYRSVLTEGVRRAASETGLSISDSQASAIPDHWDQLRVFYDVEPALQSLRSTGYQLAVLTNCDDDLFGQTQKQFRQPFDLVITAEQVKDYKPSLTHFRRFDRVTGVDRRRWVHVACSWFHDVVPAKEYGVQCVWLDRDRTGQDASNTAAHVSDAKHLVEVVQKLMG